MMLLVKILSGAIILLLIFVALGFAYTRASIKRNGAPLPEMASTTDQVDSVFVDKSDRILRLVKDGVTVKEYTISLGGDPVGHKVQEGDERTPSGSYVLDWRNPNSIAYLSLHVSYPNSQDTEKANAMGVSAGGSIMIHGISNGFGFLGALQRMYDWTNGCIAVTNGEMREIWSLVPDGTPIEIQE